MAQAYPTAGETDDSQEGQIRFSERYAALRGRVMREETDSSPHGPEQAFHGVWYDQLFSETGLCTDEGMPIRIVSPGWWNHGEGPDFKGAQIEFAGTVKTGDVELHIEHSGWRRHGHHLDARYDGVVLHVVLDAEPAREPPVTSLGRRVPTLSLGRFVSRDVLELGEAPDAGDFSCDGGALAPRGQCAAAAFGRDRIGAFLDFAGDWRTLTRARLLRERADRVGMDQAVYEAVLSACGFSRYKSHFRLIAQQLPYDRARQLARQDPLLLETALLQLAGLLPESLPEGTTAVPHFARLRALRRDHVPGLKKLPLSWRRIGVRPTNFPERRLAGAALFLSRTAPEGLAATLDRIWRAECSDKERCAEFEALFPAAMGFWASHCSWTGKKLARPMSTIGHARIQSIIGNVFIAAELALARQARNRSLEAEVFRFFCHFPKEAENRIIKDMTTRLFGRDPVPGLRFRRQQGLLQMHQDWCCSNPACVDCPVLPLLAAPTIAREQIPS
ncbi:MAG TPA: DUF2851 family protein [Candidatus Hydrogenedentes bacterium]|nr:DUF2851 family protein [Candidatus Hydrogenedentota bacterium]